MGLKLRSKPELAGESDRIVVGEGPPRGGCPRKLGLYLRICSILQQFVRKVRRVFASSSNAQGFFKRPSPRTRWPPPVGSARDRARDRARDARTPRGVQHGRPPPPGAKGRHAASPRRLATGTDRPCCPSLLRRRSLHETPRGCSNRRTGRSTTRSVQDEQKGRHVSRVTALHALPTYAFVIFSPIFSRSGRHAVLGAAYLFA